MPSYSTPFDPVRFSQDLETLSRQQLPSDWRWVASSKGTRVAFNHSASIYYKEFLPRSRMENIKSLLRGSRCARAIKLATTLGKLGFNTPEVLCSGKLSQHREYFVTRAANATGIASFFADNLRHDKSQHSLTLKRKIITALGLEIGRLHASRIIHGDLRPNNVLLELVNGTPHFYFIDNERSRHWPIAPPNKLIKKNLVQIGMLYPLDLTRTDRLRFYQAYRQNYPRYGDIKKARDFLTEIYNVTYRRLTQTPNYKPLASASHPKPAADRDEQIIK